MAKYLKLCAALFTPGGRLPPLHYAVLCLIAVAAQMTIQIHLNAHADDYPAYNPYSTAMLAFLWVDFCLLSRRLHDSGRAALYLLPLLFLTFAAYVAHLNNMSLIDSAYDEDRDLAIWSERMRILAQIVWQVFAIAAVVRPGDNGTNGFGPPFWGPTDRVTSSASRSSTTQEPAAAYSGKERRQGWSNGEPPPVHKRATALPPPRRGITPGDTLKPQDKSGFGRR